MVGKVLTGNGITAYANGAYSLIGADELNDAEREELQHLCRQRLDAFQAQRGDDVFAHRSRHRTPISGSIKYRVLTRARGRCECCGARISGFQSLRGSVQRIATGGSSASPWTLQPGAELVDQCGQQGAGGGHRSNSSSSAAQPWRNRRTKLRLSSR